MLADLRTVAPDVAVAEIGTLDARVAGAGADTRFYVLILGSFAVVALGLAGVGLFGVLAYSVSHRTREFGVRLALGATPRRVQILVLRQALILVCTGGAIGLAVALAGGRVLKAFLFELSPSDPWTLATVVAVLAAGAAVAAYLPARRASRIDPMAALRCE